MLYRYGNPEPLSLSCENAWHWPAVSSGRPQRSENPPTGFGCHACGNAWEPPSALPGSKLLRATSGALEPARGAGSKLSLTVLGSGSGKVLAPLGVFGEAQSASQLTAGTPLVGAPLEGVDTGKQCKPRCNTVGPVPGVAGRLRGLFRAAGDAVRELGETDGETLKGDPTPP